MQISTKDFFYRGVSFYGEASDLQHRFSWLFAGPDQGFELVSERTGAIVRMAFEDVHHDADSNISCWRWVPVDCDAFEALFVFND